MSEFLFGAADLIRHLKSRSKYSLPSLPRTALMCFSSSVASDLTKAGSWKSESGLGARWAFASKNLVMVSGFGLGAPAAVAKLEEMNVLGVKRVIFLGTAGGLQSDLRAGDVILPSRAFSAEGTSRHYCSAAQRAEPQGRCLEHLATALRGKIDFRIGPVWSTDAPYRESRAELRTLTNRGVLGVDMEASGLFAAGRTLGIATAGCLVVSDLLADGLWRPHFGENGLRERFLQTARCLSQIFC